MTLDLESAAWAAGGVTILAALGKFLVPLIRGMLESATTNARASGDIVQILQEERDHWKAHAERLDSTLQELRREWVTLKSKFDLMEYQLNEALRALRQYQSEKAHEGKAKPAGDAARIQ